MSYSPKYLNLDEIPVQVPDEYDDRHKVDAIETAESSIEIDINDGEELSAKDLSYSVVVSAIKQKATCELIKGAAHPNDVRLGDIQENTGKEDLAATFCERYEEMVAKINESGIVESGQTRTPYTYTTSKP